MKGGVDKFSYISSVRAAAVSRDGRNDLLFPLLYVRVWKAGYQMMTLKRVPMLKMRSDATSAIRCTLWSQLSTGCRRRVVTSRVSCVSEV